MMDIETQYKAVRENIGWIDRSELGKIAIRGADRFTWLQGMVSNDVRPLEKGTVQCVQACILNATGHILSDMALITITGETSPFVLMELPAVNVDKMMTLLDRYIIMEDVELEDVTKQWGCFSWQGSPTVFSQRVWKRPDLKLKSQVWLARDHTGNGGLDCYFRESNRAQEADEVDEIIRVGLEAQEILRVEAGIPRYGVDMDEKTLAPEAGLMATHISLTKGCYVGQEIVARIDSRGHTNRALTGLVFDAGDVPETGDKILAEEEGNMRDTGRITSVVAASPTMNGRPIALGYVRHEHRTPGSRLHVEGADRTRRAEVVALPFYRKPTTAEPGA